MSTQITKVDQFKTALTMKQDAFQKIAPENMEFAREANFAMMAIQRNPQLASCDPTSLASAIYQVGVTGLSLNPVLNHGYLIPKSGKVEFRPGYQGLINIMMQSGAVKKVEARAVYQNDEFDLQYGDSPSVIHKPAKSDKGELIAFYGVAFLPNDEKIIEYMTLGEVVGNAKRGDMNKGAKGSEDLKGPWGTDLGEMGRKTVVRRLWKYVPKENLKNGVLDRMEAAFDGDNKDAMEARGESVIELVDFEIITPSASPAVGSVPVGNQAAPPAVAAPAIPIVPITANTQSTETEKPKK